MPMVICDKSGWYIYMNSKYLTTQLNITASLQSEKLPFLTHYCAG